MTTITPTAYEKAEWARCAQAHYAAGHTAMGTRLSMQAAKLREGEPVAVDVYDTLMVHYRRWLADGTLAEGR